MNRGKSLWHFEYQIFVAIGSFRSEENNDSPRFVRCVWECLQIHRPRNHLPNRKVREPIQRSLLPARTDLDKPQCNADYWDLHGSHCLLCNQWHKWTQFSSLLSNSRQMLALQLIALWQKSACLPEYPETGSIVQVRKLALRLCYIQIHLLKLRIFWFVAKCQNCIVLITEFVEECCLAEHC